LLQPAFKSAGSSKYWFGTLSLAACGVTQGEACSASEWRDGERCAVVVCHRGLRESGSSAGKSTPLQGIAFYFSSHCLPFLPSPPPPPPLPPTLVLHFLLMSSGDRIQARSRCTWQCRSAYIRFPRPVSSGISCFGSNIVMQSTLARHLPAQRMCWLSPTPMHNRGASPDMLRLPTIGSLRAVASCGLRGQYSKGPGRVAVGHHGQTNWECCRPCKKKKRTTPLARA
jgi:hypothetical protein